LGLDILGGAVILGALGLLGQQAGLDVGNHTALREGHASQQDVELLVVADRQQDVARRDARPLVDVAGVARELQDLGAQVLQDGSQVDAGARAHPLGVVSLPQQPVDAAHGEGQARSGRLGNGALGLGHLGFLSTARHLASPPQGQEKQKLESLKGPVRKNNETVQGLHAGICTNRFKFVVNEQVVVEVKNMSFPDCCVEQLLG